MTDPLHDSSPEYPDLEAHREWCAKWAPPCPVGNPQRFRRALGFRERSVAELELRVPLGVNPTEGACQVIVDEADDEIYVRVMVCYEDEDDEDEDAVRPRRREYVDCPVRNVVQPDHGYHPAHRRRRRPESLGDTDGFEPSSRRDHPLG